VQRLKGFGENLRNIEKLIENSISIRLDARLRMVAKANRWVSIFCAW